jgi:hypothetical protein
MVALLVGHVSAVDFSRGDFPQSLSCAETRVSLHVGRPLLFSDFDQNWNLSPNLSKIPHCNISSRTPIKTFRLDQKVYSRKKHFWTYACVTENKEDERVDCRRY